MESDGCTMYHGRDVLPACLIHDLDYSLGGSSEDRKEADRRLRRNCKTLGHGGLGWVFRIMTGLFGAMGHFGDDTIIHRPQDLARPWKSSSFDIQSDFWREITLEEMEIIVSN
jgi:hypothetical protein